MMKFSNHIGRLRFLVFGSLALVVLASPLRAQDLRKWMPNVGDQFVYDEVWASSGQNGSGSQPHSSSGHDTLTMEIVKNDSLFIGDTTWHVVIVKDSDYGAKQSSQQSFYFHLGHDSNSTHSLMIDEVEPITRHPFAYDFSDSRDSQTEYGSKQITAYRFDSSIGIDGLIQQGIDSEVAVYSPELRWFLYRYDEFSSYPNFGVWGDNSDEQTMLSAALSRVDESPPGASMFFVQYHGTSLQIWLHTDTRKPLALSLLDLLGRPIRSWQLPVDAGERQITLNVADVPSGVYFIRISGGGIDEVKKVCIMH